MKKVLLTNEKSGLLRIGKAANQRPTASYKTNIRERKRKKEKEIYKGRERHCSVGLPSWERSQQAPDSQLEHSHYGTNEHAGNEVTVQETCATHPEIRLTA